MYILETPISDNKLSNYAAEKSMQDKTTSLGNTTIASKGSSKQLNELIDHKCRQLGKTKTGKGSALHLAEWMKGQLNVNKEVEQVEEEEDVQEVWSQEELKRRSDQLNMFSLFTTRNESRCEEIDMTSERSMSRNTERSHPSLSTSESQTTVKSNKPEHQMSVCKQCHSKCFTSQETKHEEEDDFDDNWGSLMMMGVKSVLNKNVAHKQNNDVDPFTLAEVPEISVLPPTPDTQPKHNHWSCDQNKTNSRQVVCDVGGYSFQNTSITSSPVPTIRKPHVKISEIIEGDDDEDTPDGSLQSDQDLPYRTLSCGTLRRFGTISSLERVGSDEQLDDEKIEEEAIVHEPPQSKPQTTTTTSTTGTHETGHVRGWTSRAGSFVAEKMAIFERLSSGNDCTVRSTSFLERYLRPNIENHLDSPPDQGTNTSSSGRGEDEGETSGATSGEEVWGTPTSGGEFEEDLGGETSAVPFMESPRESISADDDTEQLMEDLLISLPMLAVRAPGIPPRRRLEPLPEEDDTESSSAPCSPKPLHELATEKGRSSSTGRRDQHHDNCPKFGSSTTRPLGSSSNNNSTHNKHSSSGVGIGTIDRVLGGNRSSEDENDTSDDTSTSPSFFNRLRIRKNRDDGQKRSNRLLGFLGGRKVEGTTPNRHTSAAYGGKPLFKYLFNKDTVDEIPTTLPRECTAERTNEKQLERRFWKQLSRRRTTRLVQPSSPQVAV